jgi:hypothetical protein
MRFIMMVLLISLASTNVLAQSSSVPNISGIFACSNHCQSAGHKRPYIQQTGDRLLCVNEMEAETEGQIYWYDPWRAWVVTCWGSIRQEDRAVIGGGTVQIANDGSVGISWSNNGVTWGNNRMAIGAPNFSGHFSCTGNCSGDTTLSQVGSNVTCINDSNHNVAYGSISGRRSFDGCWALRATVSEDMTEIDFGQGSIWVRH